MEVIIFIVFVIVFILIADKAIKDKTNKTSNKSSSKYNDSSLEHTDCDNEVGESCFHEYQPMGDDNYTKVCKNCGHRNDKKHRRCSVCGKRLF